MFDNSSFSASRIFDNSNFPLPPIHSSYRRSTVVVRSSLRRLSCYVYGSTVTATPKYLHARVGQKKTHGRFCTRTTYKRTIEMGWCARFEMNSGRFNAEIIIPHRRRVRTTVGASGNRCVIIIFVFWSGPRRKRRVSAVIFIIVLWTFRVVSRARHYRRNSKTRNGTDRAVCVSRYSIVMQSRRNHRRFFFPPYARSILVYKYAFIIVTLCRIHPNRFCSMTAPHRHHGRQYLSAVRPTYVTYYLYYMTTTTSTTRTTCGRGQISCPVRIFKTRPCNRKKILQIANVLFFVSRYRVCLCAFSPFLK